MKKTRSRLCPTKGYQWNNPIWLVERRLLNILLSLCIREKSYWLIERMMQSDLQTHIGAVKILEISSLLSFDIKQYVYNKDAYIMSTYAGSILQHAYNMPTKMLRSCPWMFKDAYRCLEYTCRCLKMPTRCLQDFYRCLHAYICLQMQKTCLHMTTDVCLQHT